MTLWNDQGWLSSFSRRFHFAFPFSPMARVAAVNEKVPYEVLMLGAAGSGKTLLVRRIKALCHLRVPEDAADTMQTNGVELDEIGALTRTLFP